MQDDECTCDWGSPVRVDCPACQREEHLRALSFLADLVDTFDLVLVAQVLEGELARPDLAFEGLMHDIHEPISGGDMPRPYKNSAYFAPAAVLEARSAARLRTHFGLPPELSDLVHQADMMVFAAECEQNTSGPLRETRKPYKAANIQLRYWTWKEAKAQFMAAFERLAQRAVR